MNLDAVNLDALYLIKLIFTACICREVMFLSCLCFCLSVHVSVRAVTFETDGIEIFFLSQW